MAIEDAHMTSGNLVLPASNSVHLKAVAALKQPDMSGRPIPIFSLVLKL